MKWNIPLRGGRSFSTLRPPRPQKGRRKDCGWFHSVEATTKPQSDRIAGAVCNDPCVRLACLHASDPIHRRRHLAAVTKNRQPLLKNLPCLHIPTPILRVIFHNPPPAEVLHPFPGAINPASLKRAKYQCS